MADIITVNEVRDIHTVTTEINTLVSQCQNLALAYAVEIGRRLSEAKSLLPHGEWGAWLAESVSFSQRTANNLMRVFEEYGDAQITLFGAVPNSHTFANLPLSKAIKLLVLPAEEREEFAEENDVQSMSVRELEAAIKARKDAEERAEGLEKKLIDIADSYKDFDAQRDQLIQENNELQVQMDEASRIAKIAEADAEKAREELKKAKKALKDARANPEVPKDVLDKLAADAKAAAEADQADAIKQTNADAEKRIAEAEKRQKEAEAQAAALRQQTQLSDPDVLTFRLLFEQIQDDAAKLTAAFERIRAKNPDQAQKLGRAVAQMIQTAFGGYNQ